MLIVAIFQIKHCSADKVYVITCNENLCRQLKRDFDAIIPDKYRKKIFCIDGSVTELPSEPGVVLIDEYDKTLEYLIKISFSANSYRLYGLSSIVKA